MKIECTLETEKKTKTVNVGGTNYVFKRKADGEPLVATVKDKQHAKVFLSVREGYREADDDDEDDAPVNQGTPNPIDPRTLDVTGQIPGGSTNETAAVDNFVTNPPEKPLEDMTDDEIRDVFKGTLGRAANARALRETMIDQINAHREETEKNAAKTGDDK